MPNPTAQNIETPVLLDNVLLEIQSTLQTKLTWLNTAYGKCEVLRQMKDKKPFVSPAIYTNEAEYLRLFPDEYLGNFSFFIIKDGADVSQQSKASYKTSVSWSLVIWFDYRNVYADNKVRTIEHIKEEVMDVLAKSPFSKSFLRVTRTYETGKNIYREFTDSEISNQYKMRPFGALRIEGELSYSNQNTCR